MSNMIPSSKFPILFYTSLAQLMISLKLVGYWWFLVGDLEDGILFDIVDHVDICFGRYPVIFVKIRHDSQKALAGGLEDIDDSLEDGIIFDTIDHVDRWFGRHPDMISLIKPKLGAWRTFRFPDWRLEGLRKVKDQRWCCLIKIGHDLAEEA